MGSPDIGISYPVRSSSLRVRSSLARARSSESTMSPLIARGYSVKMKTLGLGGALLLCSIPAFSQSLGNAGTIQGSVIDPSGAAVPNADISIHNAVSGFNQSVKSDAAGAFQFVNVPR